MRTAYTPNQSSAQDNNNGCREVLYTPLSRWLHDYVQNMDCPDAQCRYHFDFKLAHSFRVVEEITTIGRMLQIDARYLLTARIIALLHDVGRFEQFKTYRTFMDPLSVDHGALAVRIIQGNNLLEGFSVEEQELICQAILWHNKAALPCNQSEKTSFFSKLIRDADKLDILQTNLNRKKNADILDLMPAAPLHADVSDPIYTDLMHGKNADYDELKNETDLLLSRIGWIFDLNFTPSICLYAQRKYFDELSSFLPSTLKIARILAKVRAYLDRKIA